MNNKTIKGLVIASITLIGTSYVLQKYIETRNKKSQIKKENNEEEKEVKPRNYYEIGKIVVEEGKSKVKSISTYKKAI